MRKEFQVLDEFIQNTGLRRTPQREVILNAFLSTEKHVSVEELYKLVKKKADDIGYVTVHRAMKLFSQAGLCNEIDFGDGVLRYEHKYDHSHHDHLICTECGKFIEVFDPRIEELQDKLVSKYKFTPVKHKLEIFGLCSKCLPKE